MQADWKKWIGIYALPLYFVFNFAWLPEPISWINLFAIILFFYWWKRSYVLPFSLISTILVIYSWVHIQNGVVILDYLRSTALVLMMPITLIGVKKFFEKEFLELNSSLRKATIFILFLFLFSLLIYPSNYAHFLWNAHDFIGDGDKMMRFKGLSYEPSHFALVVSPIFIYFFIRFALKKEMKDLIYLASSGVPILATLSFGFAASFAIAVIVSALILPFRGGKMAKVVAIVISISALSAVIILNTENTLSQRVDLILEGKDTSVNGRTHEAFYLARQCAEQKSLLFGIGQGQVKFIGEEVIRPYYQERDPVGYSKENWPSTAIPNASAETLAMFGFLGLILRYVLIFYFFFKARVYQNWFQLFLFIFIFTYQFMGSFFLSTAEWVIWVMVFTRLFPDFDIKKSQIPEEVNT